jgi:hypothetical protein
MESSVINVSYESLTSDGSQIRLVAIIRSETDEVVECTVTHYPFTEDTNGDLEYEALLYVWVTQRSLSQSNSMSSLSSNKEP